MSSVPNHPLGMLQSFWYISLLQLEDIAQNVLGDTPNHCRDVKNHITCTYSAYIHKHMDTGLFSYKN